MLEIVLLESYYQNIGLNDIVNIATVILALVLSIVSILAYKKTKIKQLIIVFIAFGLFGIKVFLEHLDLLFQDLNMTNYFTLLINSMDLIILILFFLALIKKWGNPKRKHNNREKL